MRKRNFTKQVGLVLSGETYKQLIEQTNRKEVSMSEWVRQAIEIRLTAERRIESNNRITT